MMNLTVVKVDSRETLLVLKRHFHSSACSFISNTQLDPPHMCTSEHF